MVHVLCQNFAKSLPKLYLKVTHPEVSATLLGGERGHQGVQRAGGGGGGARHQERVGLEPHFSPRHFVICAKPCLIAKAKTFAIKTGMSM
jgi:hypothetical protein